MSDNGDDYERGEAMERAQDRHDEEVARLTAERDEARANVDTWHKQALLAEKYLGVTERRIAELETELDHSNSAINFAHFLVDEASYTDDGQAMYVDPSRVQELRDALAAISASSSQSMLLRKINCGCEDPCTAPSPYCEHGINHSGERHGCDGCCKASAGFSSNHTEETK